MNKYENDINDIIFRAKDKYGKWLYGGGCIRVQENTYPTEKFELVMSVNYDELDNFFSSYDTEEIDPKTIGQYIKKMDSKGTKIFEGDLVENSFGDIMLIGNFGEIEYIDKTDHHHYDKDHGIVVIGNIYDNPELLKENKEDV